MTTPENLLSLNANQRRERWEVPHKPILLISLDRRDIVDGVCIRPFAGCRVNLFVNGLTLCKSPHWTFDCSRFGIYVDGDYQGNRILIERSYG